MKDEETGWRGCGEGRAAVVRAVVRYVAANLFAEPRVAASAVRHFQVPRSLFS